MLQALDSIHLERCGGARGTIDNHGLLMRRQRLHTDPKVLEHRSGVGLLHQLDLDGLSWQLADVNLSLEVLSCLHHLGIICEHERENALRRRVTQARGLRTGWDTGGKRGVLRTLGSCRATRARPGHTSSPSVSAGHLPSAR